MKISRYDKGGPNTGLFRDLGVVNFEVDDPHNPDNSYCFGYTFNGGDCRSPANYDLDHVNLFRGDSDPVPVSEDEMNDFLRKNGASLKKLLDEYVSIF